MSQRFFVEVPITGTTARLADAEAHHFIHVMRGKVGDDVVLFDGTGQEFHSQVRRVGRSDVEVEIVECCAVDNELPWPLVMGVALPKGDRQRWLVEKLTELGVTRLVPLQTRRGVAQPEKGATDRLRRAVIEASKQCRRNQLMEIATAAEVNDFFSTAPATARRLIAHPPTKHEEELAGGTTCEPTVPQPVFVAIGPEGGFTDEEVQQAVQAGAKLTGLGSRILRVETAAVALAAALTLEL